MGNLTNRPYSLGRQNVLQHARVATSGSDVSVAHNDNTLHGFHRNSSSGYVAGTTSYISDYNDCNCSYVSCSECSYDSESCTCTSADRCYCSLRTDHINSRLRSSSEHNLALLNSATNIDIQNLKYIGSGNINRNSLISCKSDDKCYCSMVEEDALTSGDFGNNQSDTTWCDTDSCVSTSKCYCQHINRRNRSDFIEMGTSKACQCSSSNRTAAEKLALDYELFTINASGKSVQPHEALSVKKSVEAAAIFADVKLSQTTDIKSMCPSPLALSKENVSQANGRNADGNKKPQLGNKRESLRMNRRHKENNDFISSNSIHKSHSADDLLGKFKAMEKKSRLGSAKSARSKCQSMTTEVESRRSFQSNNQLIRAVNASLEDTLGYLP